MGKVKISQANPEQYPEVEEWLNAVTEKQMTRLGYSRSMALFMDYTGWTPRQILDIKKEGMRAGEPRTEVEAKIVAFLRDMQKAGKYSPGTVVSFKTALGSFLSYHGFQLPKKLIRLSEATAKTIRVPDQDEVEAMIQYSIGIEAKAVITVAAECPCRTHVFMDMEWSWLEPGWEEKNIAYVELPMKFRPKEAGPKKFEPIAFIGPRGIQVLKQLKAKRGEAEARIFPYTADWFLITPKRIFQRAIEARAIRPSGPAEQSITLKSFRKYVFNAIDAATGKEFSDEYRKMFKGRDLGVEKYYSKVYIENLREIYRTKIYPLIWRQPGMDEWQVKKEAAIRALRAAGLDPELLLRTSMPASASVEEQVKFLDEQLKTVERSRRPDGGIAITAEDIQAAKAFKRLLDRLSAMTV